LQQGSRAGLATGLGAAVADGLYGAVGAFGVTGLIAWLTGLRLWLVLGGGAFLLWLAWRIWHSPVATQLPRTTDQIEGADLWRCFAGTLLLTLSNPATILSFIAVFGALAGRFVVVQPAVMIAGVFIGSALWWWLLSHLVGRLRERFDARWRRLVNRASALLLTALALWQVAGLLPLS
jgi:threonine/homoserine/homoserine lactone efflux protein